MNIIIAAVMAVLTAGAGLNARAEGSDTAKDARTPLINTQIKAQGPYFGQPLPGEKPVLFAPEVLNAVSPWVAGVAFSPDGTRVFLAVGSANYSAADLYESSCDKGVWTPLMVPSFTVGFIKSLEVTIGRDGKSLTFTGKRPNGSMDLWTVSAADKGWGKPVPMPAPINSSSAEFRGGATEDGTFYFGSDRDTPGINQVFKAAREGARGMKAERLEAPVNNGWYAGDPCVAPDGRFLVYYGARPGGFGMVDLYVSFRDSKGGWGPPINLGPDFNSAEEEYGACLSPDGRVMFFTRHGKTGNKVFWVAASAIDRFKPKLD